MQPSTVPSRSLYARLSLSLSLSPLISSSLSLAFCRRNCIFPWFSVVALFGTNTCVCVCVCVCVSTRAELHRENTSRYTATVTQDVTGTWIAFKTSLRVRRKKKKRKKYLKAGSNYFELHDPEGLCSRVRCKSSKVRSFCKWICSECVFFCSLYYVER